jgi:hypothetical protein
MIREFRGHQQSVAPTGEQADIQGEETAGERSFFAGATGT